MKLLLDEALQYMEKIRFMTVDSRVEWYLMIVLLVFGILNCILGYRLIRFWVMIFGFIVGAGAGYFLLNGMNLEKTWIMVGMIALGIAFALISFLVFPAGIFLLGAGLGIVLSVSALQPKSSAVFFLCILLGIGTGFLALKFSRVVLIVGTSLLGGFLSSFAVIKLMNLQEIPYGLLGGAVFSILGILIQLLINRRVPEEAEDDVDETNSLQDYEEDPEDVLPIDEEAILEYMEQDHDDKEDPWGV